MATQVQVVSASSPDRTAQVRIQLSTKSPDIELPEAPGPILVSTELRRYQLSTLVNRLLSTEKPIPFEFIINGIFLRTSLDDFLTENGISSETSLQVEYVRAEIPPQHVTSYQDDDWVSSIDVLSSTSPAGSAKGVATADERILSASYDGLLRIWTASGDCISTSPAAHTGPIKCTRYISSDRIVSSSLDRTVRIWSYKEDSPTSGSLIPTLELYNHTASVDRVAVHHANQKILSASSDGTLSIFSATKSGAPEAPSHLIPPPTSKRRKLSSSTSAAVPDAPKRGAQATLKAHSGPVSDVAFDGTDATVAYSASWDHTLRTWDLTTGRAVDARTTSHPLLSALPLPQLGLVAAGTSARHISLVDPRQSAAVVVPLTLRGHGNGVVALAAKPEDGFGLVSGSHDGTVRVWDVRMGKGGVGAVGAGREVESLFVLERDGAEGKAGRKAVGGEGVKVFDVLWDRTWGVVSCGADKRVQVHQVR